MTKLPIERFGIRNKVTQFSIAPNTRRGSLYRQFTKQLKVVAAAVENIGGDSRRRKAAEIEIEHLEALRRKLLPLCAGGGEYEERLKEPITVEAVLGSSSTSVNMQ